MIMRFDDRQLMAAIEDDRDFADWFVDSYMRDNLEEQYAAIAPEDLKEMVLNGRALARRHGFDDPASQAHFVFLMWVVAANFFRFPGFREIIADRSLSPAEKIERIYDTVSEEQAEFAVMNGDDRWWYPELLGETGHG